jgi:hypothetical protein
MDVETASDTTGTSRFRRWLAILVGLSAVAAALLSTLQMDSGKREERALLRASRLSVEIFSKIAGSGQLSAFTFTSFHRSLSLGMEGTGLALAGFEIPGASSSEEAIANANVAASERLIPIAESMGVSTPDAAIDEHTREVMGATVEDLTAIVGDQNREVDVAEAYGRRGTRSVFALSVLAIAAVLLGLAGVLGEGRPGTIALVAATTALVLASGLGASAF